VLSGCFLHHSSIILDALNELKMKKILLLLLLGVSFTVKGQYAIEPAKDYSHDIGNMVEMLDNLKARIEYLVKDINQEQTDFLIDDNANRIGAIIYHLAATEAYYQAYTFEKRKFNKDEKEKWEVALNLGKQGRDKLQGKPISYYLNQFDEIRAKTKEKLKEKEDVWFAEDNGGMTNHFAWFHVMEHQANHMGQLAFLTKRMPK
jgi:uncharacterized damage-inducible protein DinB